jgi:diguanylate cyclase (GGDEF)-like protein
MKQKEPLGSKGIRYKFTLVYAMMFIVPIMYMSYAVMRLVRSLNMSLTLESPDILRLAMGIPAGLAMSIAALLLMYRSMKPIKEATREAESFFKEVKGGRFRTMVAKGDDVQKISHYIIAMTEELRDRVDEVDTYARQLDEAHKKAVKLSLKDGLTGLFNRDHVEQRFQVEIERAREFNRSVSIMLVDIDNFRNYNDDYGHILGDKALKEMGEIIEKECRSIDIIGRYTNEQFLVVLPESSQSKASLVAEDVRIAVTKHEFPSLAAGKPAKLTVSIGVAGFPKQRGTFDAIIDAAKENLKHAKEAGKNRIHPPPSDTTVMPSKF